MNEKSLIGIFEEQVKKFPFSIAVVDGDQSITYRDLNKAANQLAHFLISRGVRNETLIGICAYPSIDLIIGVLAILKAGGAYCPLDPSYPIDRLKYILADSDVPILLTQKEYLENLPTTDSIIICLDDLPETVTLNSIVNPNLVLSENQLAYVLYTSSSLGHPIGAMIEQRSILNLVQNQNYIKFLPDYSVIHASLLSWDTAVIEIWGSLLNGAQLVVVKKQALQDLRELRKIIRQNLNACVVLSDEKFEKIISTMPDSFKNCRLVLFMGHKCSLSKIQGYMLQDDESNLPDRIISGYGTPETTTLSCFYEIKKIEKRSELPLGKPIANVILQIEEGELYIGGISVARGYWKQPELTRDKFVELEGYRFFKSGDYVSVRENDEIKLEARKDDQITIDGVRVSLSEIETALSDISDVGSAIINVEKDKDGMDMLIGYLTIHKHLIRISYEDKCTLKWQDGEIENASIADLSLGGACLVNVTRPGKIHEPVKISMPTLMHDKEILAEIAWRAGELTGIHFFEKIPEVSNFIDGFYSNEYTIIPQRRNFKLLLDKKLPNFMIPDKIYVFSNLPTNANGEIEKDKLKRIPKESPLKPTIHISENEEILMQLWREVLSIPNIKPTDDFFTLGGDYLLATKILTKLKNDYNAVITYEDFFSHASLSKLAVLIGNKIEASEFNPIPSISRHQTINLSPAQLRIWFLNQFISESSLFDLTKKIVFKEHINLNILKTAVQKLIKRHEALRTIFSLNDAGEPFQRILNENHYNIEIAEENIEDDNDQILHKLIKEENSIKFDLTSFPLFRVRLFNVGNKGRSFILLTCHRCISDEYSMGIIVNDLFELYRSEKEKRIPILAELPVQYADYVVWENNQMNPGNLRFKALADFWKEHLLGAPRNLELPFDFVRNETQTHEIGHLPFSIDSENLEKLKKISIESGCTLYMVLFTTFVTFLYMISGKRDMIIGEPIANRNQTDIENVVGPFENILPIRVSFAPTTSFDNLINEIKQILVNCYQNQELRFEKILEIGNIKYQPQSHPLFQIVFTFEKYREIAVAHEWIVPSYSLFDFHIFLEERENEIIGTIRYSKELFDPKTIISWEIVWSSLINEIAKNSHSNLLDLTRICLNMANERMMLKENKTQASKQTAPKLTPTQSLIYQNWKNVLNVKEFSITDSFFDLGGHSLLVIRVIAQLKMALGKNIPIKIFFDDPTIKGLSNYIDSNDEVMEEKIGHLSYPSEIPLSFTQQRLWFLNNLIQNSPVYNMPFVFRVTGHLSVPFFKKAIHQIAERHEILRTEFRVNEQGKPYQSILQKTSIPVEVINSREENPDKLIENIITRPFQLDKAPLFKVVLLEHSPDNWYFVFNFHRSIFDEVSMQIFLNDLSHFYNQIVENVNDIPSLPIQYADYALFERRHLSDDSPPMINGLAFWKKYLEKAPTTISYPLDFERPIVQRHLGNRVYFSLSEESSKKIKDIALQIAGSDDLVLLSAFSVFLYKISLQEDILVNVFVKDREMKEVDKLIGNFENIIPLRAKIKPQASMLDFIMQMKGSTSEALQHQAVPFEKILSVADAPRTLSYEPLCQVRFIYQKPLHLTMDIPHLQIEHDTFNFPIANYDLTLGIEEIEGVFKGYIEYDAEIFKPEKIKRWKERWLYLITSMTEQTELPIHDLNTLSREEYKTILYEWNETERKYPENVFADNLFEEQVLVNPEGIALINGDKTKTYSEVNIKSNQIVEYLNKQDLVNQGNLGICCERSIELFYLMMALMKLNTTFVILDPLLAPDMLRSIIKTSQINKIITKSAFKNLFESLGIEVILLDNIENDSQGLSDSNVERNKKMNDIAYLAYSFRSSVEPKEVMIEQGALANHLSWWKEYFPLEPHDVFLSLLPSHQEAFLLSQFFPLSSGSSMVIPEPGEWKSPDKLVDLIIEKSVTTVMGTPHLLNRLLDDERLIYSRLRKVIFVGERLTKVILDKAARIPNVTVYNFYGCLECTSFSIYTKVNPTRNIIPIGRPISNVKAYILDRFLDPVPIGMVGDLYIGGIGLTPGYLNHPQDIESKMIPNPFIIGEKIFKTGDLAYWLETGEIIYKGRSQHQVKLEGLPIELDEIEAVLSSFSEIEQVSVRVEEDDIVAYIVSNVSTMSAMELKYRLSSYLSERIVPDRFVFVNTLPSKLTGPVTHEQILPRTDPEKILVDIFKEILNVDNLSVLDSFFELGGDSTSIPQLVAKIKSVTQSELSLQDIYLYPTIELLAKRIESLSVSEIGYRHSLLTMIEQDIHLGDSIFPSKQMNKENGVFITGATGFLGSYILDELINKTHYDIYYLIQDNELSVAKSSEHLRKYGDKRLFPIIGDLSKPKLGIRDDIYDTLSRKISMIYHCAADVHHFHSYSQLRSPNVLGSLEILELAAVNGLKKINFISTIFSCFDLSNRNEIIENFPILYPKGTEGGHIISKWVVEKIYEQAVRRGFPITLYRPSYILESTDSGELKIENNLLFAFFRSALQLGIAPHDFAVIDGLPVDYLANIIVYSSLRSDLSYPVYNLNHPSPISSDKIFNWLNELGLHMKLTTPEKWRSDVMPKLSKDNPLFYLSSIYLGDEQEDESRLIKCKAEHAHTKAIIEKMKLSYTELDIKAFGFFIQHLINSINR